MPTSLDPIAPLLGKNICYGGDYNAEQWSPEVWQEDVALMKESGVNLVSIGIFSWAKLEPSEGTYDFEWLDTLIDLLYSNGIYVDLATPSVVPPAWMYQAYPEHRAVTYDGVPLGPGARGMMAPTSPVYRQRAVAMAGQLAQRYGQHPGVVLWHVHNEYGVPIGWDYSQHALAAWRQWLQARYSNLDGLNEAWGTSFWGQTYYAWDQVQLPGPTGTAINPSQKLDFARFSDAMLRECFIAERDEIRKHSSLPVTTNFMASSHPGTDLWKWAAEVDVVSNDNYLVAADVDNQIGLAMSADLTRSVACGQPWMLMEHSSSGVNWQPRNVAKKPGEEHRNAFSHLGRGADAIMFFQWRASRFGAEKFHSAMVPHAGRDSRVWREIVQLGADLKACGDMVGSRTQAQVAIVWDYESFWAQDLDWRPSIDLLHREQLDRVYKHLWNDGITVDFVHPSQDLSGYRLVLAPSLYLLTQGDAANLTAYVRGGGVLHVGPFSGIVNEHDTVHPGGFMSVLSEALGVWVEEFLPLRQGETLTIDMPAVAGAEGGAAAGVAAGTGTKARRGQAASLTGTVWADHLRPTTAQVLGTYASGPAPGLPAVTRNQLGQGVGWYLSTVLDGADLATYLEALYQDAGIVRQPLTQGGQGLELVTRQGEQASYLVAINHRDQEAELEVSGQAIRELLTGTDLPDAGPGATHRVTVPAGGLGVYKISGIEKA